MPHGIFLLFYLYFYLIKFVFLMISLMHYNCSGCSQPHRLLAPHSIHLPLPINFILFVFLWVQPGQSVWICNQNYPFDPAVHQGTPSWKAMILLPQSSSLAYSSTVRAGVPWTSSPVSDQLLREPVRCMISARSCSCCECMIALLVSCLEGGISLLSFPILVLAF